MKYELNQQLMQQVLDQLIQRPYADVYSLVSRVLQLPGIVEESDVPPAAPVLEATSVAPAAQQASVMDVEPHTEQQA